jgi:hypothetical protein
MVPLPQIQSSRSAAAEIGRCSRAMADPFKLIWSIIAGLFHLVFESHDGTAQCRFRGEARGRERLDTVVVAVDGLKALDPKRPIRQATDLWSAPCPLCPRKRPHCYATAIRFPGDVRVSPGSEHVVARANEVTKYEIIFRVAASIRALASAPQRSPQRSIRTRQSRGP